MVKTSHHHNNPFLRTHLGSLGPCTCVPQSHGSVMDGKKTFSTPDGFRPETYQAIRKLGRLILSRVEWDRFFQSNMMFIGKHEIPQPRTTAESVGLVFYKDIAALVSYLFGWSFGRRKKTAKYHQPIEYFLTLRLNIGYSEKKGECFMGLHKRCNWFWCFIPLDPCMVYLPTCGWVLL